MFISFFNFSSLFFFFLFSSSIITLDHSREIKFSEKGGPRNERFVLFFIQCGILYARSVRRIKTPWSCYLNTLLDADISVGYASLLVKVFIDVYILSAVRVCVVCVNTCGREIITVTDCSVFLSIFRRTELRRASMQLVASHRRTSDRRFSTIASTIKKYLDRLIQWCINSNGLVFLASRYYVLSIYCTILLTLYHIY